MTILDPCPDTSLATKERLEVKVMTPRVIIFKNKDFSKLTVGNWIRNQEGTRELIIRHEINPHSDVIDIDNVLAMKTLRRVPNAEIPTIITSCYDRVNREGIYIFFFENVSHIYQEGKSVPYNGLNKVLKEAEE